MCARGAHSLFIIYYLLSIIYYLRYHTQFALFVLLLVSL